MNDQFTTNSFTLHSQHLRDLRRQAQQRQAQHPTASRRGNLRTAFTAHLWRTLTGVAGTVSHRARNERQITGELARSHK